MQKIAATTNKWTAKERRIIEEFVSVVRKAFKERIRKIILYGSRARGDADEESDYDFLLLLDEVTGNDKRKIRQMSWEISYEYNTVVMAKPVKKSEFTEARYFYFYENVCKEGIEL